MELMKSWAITLAGIVVFGSACEVILPDGTFRKYIRLSIGMVLILTLLSPVQELLKKGDSYEMPEISRKAYTQRSDMEQTQRGQVLELYKKNLNTKMSRAICSRLGESVFEVQCKVEEENPDTFGTILNVHVLTEKEEKADFAEEVKTILYQDFGVSKDKVTVLSKESIG